MKNSVKYLLCGLLSLALIAAVVFMPNAYYRVADSRAEQSGAEDFTLPEVSQSVSDLAVINELLHSENAIWIDDSSYRVDELVREVSEELSALFSVLSANRYAKGVFDYVSDVDNKEISVYEVVRVSGTAGNVAASVTLFNVTFELPVGNLNVLYDCNNRKIYELICTGEGFYSVYTDEEFENLNDVHAGTRKELAQLYSDYLDYDISSTLYVFDFDGILALMAFNAEYSELRYGSDESLMDYYNEMDAAEISAAES